MMVRRSKTNEKILHIVRDVDITDSMDFIRGISYTICILSDND
jgi:hypothetical protein